MIQRLGGQAIEFRNPVRGVPGIGEQTPALAQHVGVEPDQPLAQADILFVVAEIAERRSTQLVRCAVLMNQPADLVRVTNEVGRELRGDQEIDRPAVALTEIDEPPGGRVRKDFVLRVPLERDADELSEIPAGRQLARQLPHVGFRAAVHERHLRLADYDRDVQPYGAAGARPGTGESYHVACLKLITSPSSTMYSLPSRRSSP